MSTPAASIIVRAKNEAAHIERALSHLRAQTADAEVIVVASGSTDGTVEIAKRWCDELIQIAPEDFSYGGALNLGAARASSAIHMALSAHCHPERNDWIERSLAHYERSDVAATGSLRFHPDDRPLVEVFYQDAAHARIDPYWGFSNHASSWRASVWERFPFNEEMDACEDKDWAWRVLDAGWVIVFDPVLLVGSAHRETQGVRALFDRTRREARALARYASPPPFSLAMAAKEWWNDIPPDTPHPPLFHRLNYYRVAKIAGRHIGQREGFAGRSGR